jgi:TonB family protein
MEPSLPLYEVILSGRGRQSFDIQFDKHGKGFQSSGDPNGYFFFIAGGFHFVPTEALLHLPDGRPAPGHKQPLLPKLVHSAPAVYPDAARKAKVSGTVKMHLVVDVNGKVIRVTVKDGDPRLVKAAEDAVRKWEFKAPRVDGKPIQSEIDAEVSFSFY